MGKSKMIMEADDIKRAIRRIAHEIVEAYRGIDDLYLIGIKTRGVPLADRIKDEIEAVEGISLQVGLLDITLYRDDLEPADPRPILYQTDIPFAIDGMRIIVVDDVLFTGRTIRAALDAVMDRGRPRSIGLAVLVDRGHRELPIQADFVGKSLPTARRERVQVLLREVDGQDAVIIEED